MTKLKKWQKKTARNKQQYLPSTLLLLSSVFLATFTHAAEQPNVLLISMDDANQEHFGTFGSTLSPSPTPSMDQLANEGMKFTHAHTVVANCVPSRNVTLSGMYPHQNGVEGFRQVWKSRAPLLPDLMKANGYLTGILGKDSHSTPYVPYAWDVFGSDGLSRESSNVHDEATRVFDQAKTEGKPFFYMYNTHDPHRKFWGINKALVENQGEMPQPSYIYSDDDVVVPPSMPDIADVRLETQYYLSTLRRGDDLLNQVLEALDESGMADNTIVIFYSDHGWAMPFAKTNLWNASTRTPLIVRWPGKITAGTVNTTEMVSVVDFLPTILDVAGITVPEQVEGNTIKPLLLGQSQPEVDRDKVFKAYYQNSGSQRRPMRAIQTKRYNYIFNPWSDGVRVMASTTQSTGSFIAMEQEGLTNPAVQERVDLYNLRVLEEFYDHETDPYELDNKINDPAYQSVIKGLQDDLQAWMLETDDSALMAFINKSDQTYLDNWMAQQQAEVSARGSKLGRKKVETVFHANNDYFNITAGQTLTRSADQGLTANDYEAPGATGVTATLVTAPSNGTLSALNADGSFTYTPADGFTGVDSFVYRADSIGTDDTGNVTVSITVVGSGEATQVLLTDDFESGSLTTGGWTNEGTGSAEIATAASSTGTYGARVKNGAILTTSFSTEGFENINVSYDRSTVGLTGAKNLTVEWSANGTDWNTLEVTQDTAWASKSVYLPAAAEDQLQLTLRFNTNGVKNVEKAYVDNVNISGDVIAQEPTPPAPTALVANGSFEDNTGWEYYLANRVSGNARTGNYAGEISVGGDIKQLITGLKPNTSYTLSAYLKTSETVGLFVKDYGGSTVSKWVTGSNYALREITFTTGASNTSALIYAYTSKATSYVDDVSLVEN